MREPKHEVYVTADMYYCEGLSKNGPARDVIHILRQAGASFWCSAPQFPNNQPELRIGDDGDLFAGIFHPSLERSYQSLPDRTVLTEYRDLRLVVGKSDRSVWLAREVCGPNAAVFDAMVQSQRLFAESLIPLFCPLYGWIDEKGENAIASTRYMTRVELRFLFWSNIFGPAYVQKYGRNFLLDAPVWKATDLGAHGVSLTVCESFMKWLDNPYQEVVDYFRQIVPGIKRFWARRVPL